MSSFTNPLISILLPVYNGSKHLAASIQSILDQPYQPKQVIIIDDGSTDDSGEIVKRFNTDIIIYHRQNRSGTAAARNKAVKLATGEYLAHADADDLWVKDRLALQFSTLRDNPDIDAVFGLVDEFYGDELSNEDQSRLRPLREKIAAPLLTAMLIQRKSHLKVGDFQTKFRIGQDMDWYMRAKDAGLCFLAIPHLVLLRRVHNTNKGILDRDFFNQRLEIIKEALDRRRGCC